VTCLPCFFNIFVGAIVGVTQQGDILKAIVSDTNLLLQSLSRFLLIREIKKLYFVPIFVP
jgi:hypothetical protein